jgi:hypothetical protein
MRLNHQVVNRFDQGDYGGAWEKFLDEENVFLALQQQDLLQGQNNRIQVGANEFRDVAGGICMSLSLAFVRGRSQGLTIEQVRRWMTESLVVHQRRQAFVGKVTEEQRFGLGAYRGSMVGGRYGSRAFTSRADLLHQAVNFAGLSIAIVSGYWSKSAGHAVAFDTRNGHFHFFDANAGFFTAEQVPQGLIDWFSAYWEAIGYKQRYSWGKRHLIRFAAVQALQV